MTAQAAGRLGAWQLDLMNTVNPNRPGVAGPALATAPAGRLSAWNADLYAGRPWAPPANSFPPVAPAMPYPAPVAPPAPWGQAPVVPQPAPSWPPQAPVAPQPAPWGQVPVAPQPAPSWPPQAPVAPQPAPWGQSPVAPQPAPSWPPQAPVAPQPAPWGQAPVVNPWQPPVAPGPQGGPQRPHRPHRPHQAQPAPVPAPAPAPTPAPAPEAQGPLVAALGGVRSGARFRLAEGTKVRGYSVSGKAHVASFDGKTLKLRLDASAAMGFVQKAIDLKVSDAGNGKLKVVATELGGDGQGKEQLYNAQLDVVQSSPGRLALRSPEGEQGSIVVRGDGGLELQSPMGTFVMAMA